MVVTSDGTRAGWGGLEQGNLPAVFRNGGLELLRPGLNHESGYIECFPKASWKKPYLLEQLELFLEQKVRKSVWAQPGFSTRFTDTGATVR